MTAALCILAVLFIAAGCVSMIRLIVTVRRRRQRTDLEWAMTGARHGIDRLAEEIGEALTPAVLKATKAMRELAEALQ